MATLWAMVAPILANTWTVGEFLSAHQASIPELQRPYAWGTDQAKELIRDLERIIALLQKADPDNVEVPQHFFGTIVLLQSGEVLPIIDGQQRLTTATSLLAVIEHAFREVADEAVRVGAPEQVSQNCLQIADEIRTKLWVAGPMDSKGRLVSIPRLRVSNEIAEGYKSVLEGKELVLSARASQAEVNLSNNVNLFEDFVKDKKRLVGEPVQKFRYLHSVYRAVSSGLLVVSLKTSASDAGYDLFESLNSKGLELNVLDLLKVWMMSCLAKSDCPPGVMAEAASSLQSLSGGDVEFQKRFFDHYFRARALRNTGKDGYKKLALESRKVIFHDPSQDGVPDHLDQYQRILFEIRTMDRWVPIAHDLESEGNPAPSCVNFPTPALRLWASRRILHLKKTMKHTGVLMPLLLVSGDVLRNDHVRFSELVHTVEKFFFRYKTICGGPVKELENAYYGFIRVLDANGSIDIDLVKNRFAELIDEYADDTKFIQRLGEKLTYRNAGLVKYVLHTLHLYGLPPHPKKDPSDLTDWWLEHIAPQNPQGDPDVSPELVHNLGNLCLLNPEINQALSNLPFLSKKQEILNLKKSNVNIDVNETLAIFSGDQQAWTDIDVVRRQSKLIDRIVEVYSF